MKQLVVFIGLITSPLWSIGQSLPTLKGTVKSSKQEPLPGITIKIKNASRGTTTNGTGQFTITATPTDTLLITGIGYRTLLLPVNGRNQISIQLEDDATALTEVLVVGYGTQKKSDLTGSITSISEEQFKKTPAVSLDQGLRGRATGVQVSTTSNQPGGATSIRIRGSNSVNTGSEPLYVIDGFPVYNDNSGAGASAGPKLNALSLINPNDIVSVEVLKDASAAAIYGARGANGVVLVTTKKGQSGATKFDFNAYYGIQKVAKTIPVLNATEFAKLVNDASGSVVYTPEQIAGFGEGTNWQKEVLRTAPVQNYQLAASGGDARTKYMISLNYYNQEGIIINSDFKRYSARFNFERQATERLSYGSNITIARTDANQALSATSGGEGTIGVMNAALAFNPILPVYKADGTYVLENDRGIPMGNPVATAKELTNNSVNNRMLGNIYINYKILPDLEFRTSLGTDIYNTREKYYAPRTTLRGFNVQGYGAVSSANSTSWLNENTFTYNKKFAKHSITALAGYTMQQYKREIVTASASGFVNDLLKADNLASGAVVNTPVTNTNTWSLASFIGRINYAYNNKYLLTLTARADGSSKFGANNKFGYFPSGSVAWKLSEEDWIKDLNIFHELKLRASYGKTGNQEISSYQSLAGLTNMSYIIGDQVVKGYAPGNIPNKDLKWESTAQTDVGLDVSFFRGRLNFTADAYYKKTTDMLLWINVPWSTGFASALQNIGSVENKGVELGINARILEGNFTWSTNFNISANRNKVLDLGPVQQILTGEINGYLKLSDPIVIKPGEPLNAFYGYVSDGIFQLKDDIANSPQPTAQAGDRKYKDIVADGKLDANDRKFIGYAQPKFFGGWSNDFAWKGFDLNTSFNFVYGNSILNSSRIELDQPTGAKNSSARVVNRWSPANPGNTIPRASLNRSFLFNDSQLEDGSYFRLGNIALGYTLPQQWTRTAHIDRLRVYVSAQNLFTLTSYTGYDPETNQSGQDNVLRGIDADAYPSAKTFMVGINVGF